jgi:hypothetical protein
LGKTLFKKSVAIMLIENTFMGLSCPTLLLVTHTKSEFFDLISLILQKLFEFLLADSFVVIIAGIARVDRGVSVSFGKGFLEAKTAGDTVRVLLKQFADVSVDDLVPAVDDTGLDQRLPVVLAGKEVLQVSIGQCLVQRTLLQRRNSELPAIHLEFIIFCVMGEEGKDINSKRQ